MVVIIFCKYLSIINNHIKGSGICPGLEFFADDLPLVYVRHLFFANDLQNGGGPAFSHLFFADNLVSFAKADRKNCVAIREVLDSFCCMSGQKVSQDKSRVFFSPNVPPDARIEMCETLGFRSTPSLGTASRFWIHS